MRGTIPRSAPATMSLKYRLDSIMTERGAADSRVLAASIRGLTLRLSVSFPSPAARSYTCRWTSTSDSKILCATLD